MDLVADLTRWLAETRVDAAAASRARTAWLRRQLDDEATLAGVLLDLAEREAVVALTATGGRAHHGVVRAVGEDFCALRDDRADTLVSYAAIVAVRPVGVADVLAGTRPAALDMTLAEALRAVLDDRPQVAVVHFDATSTSGELRSVGHDVVVLRREGRADPVYLPLGGIGAVSIARR